MRAAARNRIETVECHGALWDSSSMYERADEVSFCRYFESCWYLTFFLSASWEPTTLRSCLHLERSDPLRLRCFVTFRDIVILIQYILIYHILCIRIFTYIYIYILVSGMVPMPSYVLNFMQQIWGATLVKTCIHIYIYILWSQLFHEWFWMILNDRGWICASNASSLGLAMVAWWSTRWRRESSGDALWLAVCQEGCYWLIVMLERLGESSFAFAICRASSLFNHIVMNIHINWHCNV